MGGRRVRQLQLLILLSGALLCARAAPTGEPAEEGTVTQFPAEQIESESRSQKDVDILEVDEDLDGRSAYVNNQFVPSEPVELVDDEQNAPLYEILQKQMEQVLASTGPNDPVYEHREKQDRRDQQPPNRAPPLFTNNHPNDAESDDDYEDEEDRADLGYNSDQEKPDAASLLEEDEQTEAGYQVPQLQPSTIATSTTRRPHRRRSTTAHPRTTRARASAQPRATPKPANLTTTSSTSATEAPAPTTTTSPSPRPSLSPSRRPLPHPSNSLPSDPQVYQHKRRIIFKTISTGSQFINSPIGDLMIKFSIGFAKPANGAAAVPSTEALRALSNNLLRSIELQKLKRANKVPRD
ncbi:uncharacterized protein LOC117579427 [Drosophila guanche]|uniref:Uncharacterized protein n=1 Tax=Drosophila guanche TaxID=7266 RepID=A0A3B0JUP5_DROGU|nr:uncharacterized protein LOC117579427 [Drosophila guanche]SPP76451.1 Hypothetical predicted protein [Drosophila guanche]